MKRSYLAYGAGLYIVGVAGSYVFSKIFYQQPPESPPPLLPSSADGMIRERERKLIFDGIANCYDSSIGWTEKIWGISFYRHRLLSPISGDVLEVAAGTGRNLEYYQKSQVDSINLIDYSEEMKKEGSQKFRGYEYFFRRKLNYDVMSAEKMVFPDSHFDSVVDTFGLCSFEDPSAALQEMKRVCKSGGKIYLLEHGRSSWSLLNSLLDKNVDGHVQKWGCTWNRDIEDLVEKLDLRVVKYKRHHFGTLYYYILEKGEETPTLTNS